MAQQTQILCDIHIWSALLNRAKGKDIDIDDHLVLCGQTTVCASHNVNAIKHKLIQSTHHIFVTNQSLEIMDYI